ncbi:MAG: uL22 family ribosomal protein, partial [Candidatus Binataceae bacterium]
MEALARTRFVRISAQKLRLVCALVAGKRVDQALSILEFTPKK